ncbi:MAG: FAD-binding oxidoreductase [Betaproteobacteria bacterium]|nr:FAD-binding oxidoreductase [Betaproteobacteria bacterium]
MQATIIEQFAAIVGTGNVLTGAEAASYCADWRKQYAASAQCVARPGTTEEVAQVVRLAAAQRLAIVPQGGNTGLCGGSVPTGTRPEIVVSLSRMNRVRSVDALNNTLTAEAGCVLAELQRTAAAHERLFPLSLGAEGSCQIGGNLSTNAGGVNVLRYGNTRDLTLGLEVVLPDGRVWNGLRGLRKDNTGYDLKQLFVGAEGTLGIITAAVLKLYPLPSASATAWIAVESPARAVELLAALRSACGDRLSAFELISRHCVEAVLAHRPGTRDPLAERSDWYVLAELTDTGEQAALAVMVERALDDCAQRRLVRDVALAASQAQSAALWQIRESIPEAQFKNVKHDVSVPVSLVPEFIARAGIALDAVFPGTAVFCFGHVGDGNLHYNIGDAALVAKASEVNRIVYGSVAALGGSISAEHGLGQLKREEIRHHKSALEMELMQRIKQAFDPQDLMNPGKVL